MKTLAWVTSATWPAVVKALREHHRDDQIRIVTVADAQDDFPPEFLDGLFGRGHRPPAAQSAELTDAQARKLLDHVHDALGYAADSEVLTGPTERLIVKAAAWADWLVMARDGDLTRLGPASLGRGARFIIDHAPCTIELVWPGGTPSLDTLAPAPPHP